MLKDIKIVDENHEMYSEVKVEFGFSGFDEDPDEVSEIIGLKPDEIKRKGEPLDYIPGKLRNFHSWILIASKDKTINMEDQIDMIIKRLMPLKDKLVKFSEMSEKPFLNLVIKSYGGDRPLINYRADVIKFLAEIGAGSCVDLCVYGDDGLLPIKEIEL
jgi:hypothetical protein